jgi:hypothetical protein
VLEGLDPREHIEPAHARQPHVEEHHVEMPRLETGERLVAICRLVSDIARLLQYSRERQAERAVIVHDQDPTTLTLSDRHPHPLFVAADAPIPFWE